MYRIAKAIKNQRLRKVLAWIGLIISVGYIFIFPPLDLSLNFNKLHISTKGWISILLAISLVPLQWFIEYFKWKISLSDQQVHPKRLKISFFRGMVFGFILPGSQGSLIGKWSGLGKKRKKTLLGRQMLTQLFSFQLTILVGVLFAIWNHDFIRHYLGLEYNYQLLCVGIILLSGIASFISFRWFKSSNPGWNNYFLSRLGTLTFLRYSIFVVQFALLLSAFYPSFQWMHFQLIPVLFLLTTLSPSLFFGKILIRESLAVWVFGIYDLPLLSILLATLVIWSINNALPALYAWIQLILWKR